MNEKPFVGRSKAFYEQLNFFIKDKAREKEEFDKRFFYTLSSFFAFSVLLIQFMKKPDFVDWLLFSWAFNSLALLSHLFAYLSAEKTHDKRIKAYLEIQDDDNERNEFFKYLVGIKRSKWGKITTIIEIISYLGFVLAIISLLAFVYLNFVN